MYDLEYSYEVNVETATLSKHGKNYEELTKYSVGEDGSEKRVAHVRATGTYPFCVVISRMDAGIHSTSFRLLSAERRSYELEFHVESNKTMGIRETYSVPNDVTVTQKGCIHGNGETSDRFLATSYEPFAVRIRRFEIQNGDYVSARCVTRYVDAKLKKGS